MLNGDATEEPDVGQVDAGNRMEGLRPLLSKMMLIRAYEQMLISLHGEQRAGGTCTSVGQEAAAVGVVSALAAEDLILTNHRSAAHLLARGADPGRLLAEVLGRRDGYCKGKSGSLHISAKDLGVILTSTIVGGELSLAPGVALSRSALGGRGIVVCFFGDGAACEGRFHEALNLSAVWQLPILFVCENNHWQAFVHRRETTLSPNVATQAGAYGMEFATVYGNDVRTVREAAESAVTAVREMRRPFLLELVTYRLRGHMEPDDQWYVDQAELSAWRKRDPIELLQRQLLQSGDLSLGALRELEDSIAGTMAQALAFAEASPPTGLEELIADVYA